MKYNPQIHHRRSVRLTGYDYAQAGAYFITICCQNKACLFGDVVHGEMVLNDAGKMVEKWFGELCNKFPDIELGEYVVMPNHFHGIVINTGAVGANLCVRPPVGADTHHEGRHAGLPLHAGDEHDLGIQGEHIGSPLRGVVQWFKTMTTNEYIRGVKTLDWQPFNGKLWQRNYHEHIIRNEQEYQRIARYIINNPAKWQDDKLYKQ